MSLSPRAVGSTLLTALLGLTACGSDTGSDDVLTDPAYSLYALVATIDGTSFAPPLGPEPTATWPFDATLLARLEVVLEATDGGGRETTLGRFTSSTQPGLVLLAPHELYWMNVPAAAYFTDPALAYRFRALLDGREIGRSDMSSKIFEVMSYVPTVPVGVKLRLEARPAPALASVQPTTLVAGSSDFTLTVAGSAFMHDSIVRFAGQDLATTWVSATELTARVPATLVASAGASSVSVVTPAPGGGTSAALSFLAANPIPELTAIAPAHTVLGAGGLTVTLTGASFVAGAHATFAGTPLATTYVSAGELRATLPAALVTAAGGHAVAVVNPDPGGASAPLVLTVENPIPSVATLTPAAATAGSGQLTLTIDGASFVPGAVASLNGQVMATTFSSATRLTAVIPAASLTLAGTFNVAIANPAPAAGASGAASFTIRNPVPVLSTTAPTSAAAGSSAFTLTVNGSSFVSGAAVSFGGLTLSTTFVSSTRVTASVPASAVAGGANVNVAVTNPAPTTGSSAPLTFVVSNPAPALSSISPTSGISGSGAFTLTLTGSGFNASTYATFNGAALATTFVSSTQLTALVPAAAIAANGAFNVTAVSPAPGGGASAAQVFTLTSGVGQSAPAAGTTCLDVLNRGGSTGSGVYWIQPAGAASAFQVYCDMTMDGGGWTVFMFVNRPLTVADTTRTIINPSTLDGYYYMTQSNFASLARTGMQVRAWGIHTQELWLECGFESVGTTYKNWRAALGCRQRVGLMAGGYAVLSGGYLSGFIYQSPYDAINPANQITGNSVFTKIHNGSYSSGWDMPGTTGDTRTTSTYRWYYGTWETTPAYGMIYALR